MNAKNWVLIFVLGWGGQHKGGRFRWPRQSDRKIDRQTCGAVCSSGALKLQPWGRLEWEERHCPFCPNKPHQDSWHEVQGIDISSRYAVCCSSSIKKKGTEAGWGSTPSLSALVGGSRPAGWNPLLVEGPLITLHVRHLRQWAAWAIRVSGCGL